MELYELGMALATERIAEPRREAEHAALPGRPVGSGPGAHNRRLGGTPVDRERGTALLTRDEHLLPHHHRREAAKVGPRPQGPPVRPSRPASDAIGALCSSSTAIPWPVLRCWPAEPPQG